jgi:RimJ/RimL family protein N-acetyltransferase
MVGIADNQCDVAAALADAGAAIDLGPAHIVAAETIAKSLCDLAGDFTRRGEMSSRAANICDGLGARRVASVLAPWPARDGEPVTLRPVAMADAELMHRWQKLPAVRRHTPNPAPPSWQEHLSWFKRRLADPAAGPFSIIVKGGRDVGVVRLDRFAREAHGRCVEPDALCVSIYLEPESHGQGAGTAALAAARFLVAGVPFYAEVLPDNAASHRLFERAGYREVSPGLYRQAPARGPRSRHTEHPSQRAQAL